MPTPPYAKLLVEVNSGGPQNGAVYPNLNDSILLRGENVAFWQQQKFEVYDFPVGFALPSGWSDTGTGTYFYEADPYPPAFTVTPWGKFMLRLTVDRGLNGAGAVDAGLLDESTALSVLSPTGLRDLGFLEANQFNPEREWTGDEKANLRILDAGLGAGSRFEVFNVIAQESGSGGPLAGFVVELADFPLATRAIFYAEIWADGGSASDWTTATNYVAGPPSSIVNVPTGQGGTNAVYVCTTGGLSAGTVGPTGNGTNLQDNGASPCRWRSALAHVTVAVNLSPVASASTGYTLAGALASGGGASALRFSLDLSAYLTGLSSPVEVIVVLAGDAADTGSVTLASIQRAWVVFS